MDASIDHTKNTPTRPKVAIIIVAGGRSLRMNSDIPKPYIMLGDAPVLRHTLTACVSHARVDMVQTVIHPEHESLYHKAATGLSCLPPIHGGKERQDSVRAGLLALKDYAPDLVLIHDAARPLATHALLTSLIDALAQCDAVMPALAVADTLRKQVDNKWVDIPRTGVLSIQTPQGFHFSQILDAHLALASQNLTDDIAVLLAHKPDARVQTVAGERSNNKITLQEDIAMAKMHLTLASAHKIMPKVALGFDVHRFVPHKQEVAEQDRVIWLGGIAIKHTHALEGHSDADVVLHALTDALLGAIAKGDIGVHFPPSDAKWKGANSAQFITHAAGLVAQEGLSIFHVDVTLMCEVPKLTPHRDAMRQRIAALLQIDVAQVSVKATTTEGLGFTGRKEGIAAHAIVTVG